MHNNLRILYLEDNREDVELVIKRLQSDNIGCEVKVVEKREDYEASLRAGDFDIIFADYTLPSFDGLTALAIAMDMHCDKPFIFISGTMGEEVAIESLKKGAMDYVLKNKLIRLAPAVQRAMKEYAKHASLQMQMVQEKALMTLHQEMTAASLENIISFVLEKCVLFSGSSIGFIGSVADDESFVTAHLWSERAIANCKREEPKHIPIKDAGLWAEAIRQRKTIVVNDYNASSYPKRGYPEGDLPLTRFMGIPAVENGRVVFVVCLANKKTDYSEEDVRQVSLLIESMSGLVRRKRIEEELRKSEAKYRNLVETISDFIWEHDERGILTYVSPQARAMIGYAPDEMVGKRLMDFIAGDEARPASAILGECLDTQRPFIALENTTLHKDGHPIAVETNGVPFFDEEGKLRGYRGICRNVTERRLAEQALVKSEERYKRLVESVTDYIYTVKVENGHSASTTHGPACAAVTGYTTDEFSADPHLWYRMVHEEDREQVLEYAQRILSGELPPPMEHRIIHKDGSVRWVRNTFVPQFNEEGLLVAYDGMISDVTERRTAEEAVKEEKAFTENALNMLGDVFFVLDLEGRLLRWNKALNDVSGYSDKELVSLKPRDFFPDGDIERVSNAIQSVIEKGTFSSELTAVTKEGRQIPYEFRAALMRDYTGNIVGISGVGRDLTERHKLEAQLRYAQKMEAIGTLTGGIAHDFNNILNVIIGFGTMLMKRIGDDKLAREQMNEVLTAAERAATLTKRLLVFSRKQVVEVRPVDINELVLGLQKMLARIIRESIEFNLDLADRPLMVLADSGQIEQVLMNLTANARDAMPEGGRLTIGTGPRELDDEYVEAYGYGKTGTYALITVADTGQGMDAETQKKIFEPFFTTKGVGEGTGLGLAISYGIIKQHSGYIKVYSEPGHGTVFKIYLPLIEETTLPAERAESPDAVRGGNETILVAEDDASMRKFSSIVLESCGYRVITADDGEDAITKFMENRERISLALLDMIMPKKNGKEVGEAIRKVSPRTKVLFTSGYAMDGIRTKELAEAGYGFIHKPVRSQDLLRKVREFLDK